MAIRFKRKLEASDNDLRFGDIVFIDDRSFMNLAAWLVRYVELGGKLPGKRFVPNHIAMVKEENPKLEEVKVYQSDWSGVLIKKLGLWTNHKKVNIVFKRYPRQFTYDERYKMGMWALQQQNKGYDWLALIGIFLEYLVIKYSGSEWVKKVVKAIRNPLDIKERFICSEYVCLIFRQIKIKLCKDCDPSNVTPYGIYQNNKLQEINRNFNFSYTRGKPLR